MRSVSCRAALNHASQWPKKFFMHVVHIIVDGQIDNPRLREGEPNRPAETVIPPSAIADAVITYMRQPRTGWSHEIDIRPAVESFRRYP